MLEDIVVLILLLAGSLLIVILSFDVLVQSLCNHLGSVVLYVPRRIPAISSTLSSNFSNLAQGISLSPTMLQLGIRTRPRLVFLNMEHDIAFPVLLLVSDI